ncbi:MAG: hypothetical protein SFX73_20485 [Kofleriaceae bacterium]|nr:hypothetical protein [Kofleriaceae bacterium]
MRILIACLMVLAPLVASAQPAAGSADGAAAPAATGSAAAGSATAGSAAGSADPAPALPTAAAAAPPAPSPEQLRATCAAAMNADPTFAEDIVKSINEDTYKQHARAADAIEKNEKHVVYAYAGFWVLAALFVVFLWRRQQGLKAEIAQLRRDLDAAAK